MCLYPDPQETLKLQTKLQRKDYIVAYKLMQKDDKSPLMQKIMHSYNWYESDYYGAKKETYFYGDGTVGHGIHVFLFRSNAAIWCDSDCKVIPVKCYAKDFIASSKHEAVFSRVWVNSTRPTRLGRLWENFLLFGTDPVYKNSKYK